MEVRSRTAGCLRRACTTSCETPFSLLDADHDGFLTWDEVMAVATKRVGTAYQSLKNYTIPTLPPEDPTRYFLTQQDKQTPKVFSAGVPDRQPLPAVTVAATPANQFGTLFSSVPEKGVLLKGVTPGSPTAQAFGIGGQAVSRIGGRDLIQAINGQLVDTPDKFHAALDDAAKAEDDRIPSSASRRTMEESRDSPNPGALTDLSLRRPFASPTRRLCGEQEGPGRRTARG